jgi:hypothetical protein
MTIFRDRVYGAFDPATEGQAAAEAMRERLFAQGHELDDIVEDLNQENRFVYGQVEQMRLSVCNLFTVGLFHKFEQQARELWNGWTDSQPDDVSELCTFLRKTTGINLKTAPSWTRVTQLQHAANVIKHVEGGSAGSLRNAGQNSSFTQACMKSSTHRAGVLWHRAWCENPSAAMTCGSRPTISTISRGPSRLSGHGWPPNWHRAHGWCVPVVWDQDGSAKSIECALWATP